MSSILVIDDSAMMRKIILRLLGQAGLTVSSALEAADGSEALAILGDHSPTLILCDINMPSISGLELLARIRDEQLAPSVPIVMITTENSEAQVRQAIALGARGYIRKPFTVDDIKATIIPLLA
ncbi:MAG TPA: response regulator [Acidobacteriaceae bacterium]|nr:response regulator [Acidobacteriaceae bacterium]